MKLSVAIPRVIAMAVALGCGLVAWRFGGGAEASVPPPRAEEAGVSKSSSTSSDGGASPGAPASTGDYEVAIRLIEIAKDAKFDMPRDSSLKPIMKAHWRQVKPPFSPMTGEASKFVSTVALRTSAVETQWAMSVGKDAKAWAPEARVWNMNEGSFDQREALVSTTPGSVTYRITVPQGARFTFAEGTMNQADEPTAFVVTVVDQKGTTKQVHRHVLSPSASRKWTEQTVDLSPYAGQNIELRLATERAKGEASDDKEEGKSAIPESAYAGPGNGKVPVDAGVVKEEVLTTPGAAVALWGNPTILARTQPRAPYNVLWIVIDALRPDVCASFHDDAEDAAKEKAPWPPMEALLPKVAGLTPAIDDLASRGARFTHAYSAASWTRPGTLAMLAGARSTELGIDTLEWMIPPQHSAHFYGSDPPLLSLLLRRQNLATRAFVNNYFLVGYAPVGVDFGFERVDDHRYRTRDTLEITNDATSFIRNNKDTRFFAFVNYNSPHEPYEPPQKFVDRIPPPPAGPKDKITRLYMAEAAKDDDAIATLMKTLDETGLREKTIIVVTADHGETLSFAHSGTSGLEKMPIRYHHAVSMFEETTRVPIVIVAPNQIAPKTEVKARVRTTDIAPTVLELLGMEPHPRMSGKSMLGLVKGQTEPDERVVVSEGRGSRAIMHGKYRLITRTGDAKITIQGNETRESEFELYDLENDPGERHDLAKKKPEIIAEMKARLEAALKNVPVAGSRAAVASTTVKTSAFDEPGKPPVVHLRFAGGPNAKRVSGAITIGDAKTKPKSFDVQPVDLGQDAFKVIGEKVDVALRTSPERTVGFDVTVDPPGTPIVWDLYLDDQAWPDERIFGGPYGLLAPVLKKGLLTDEARIAANAGTIPTIDPRRDLGVFVTRERPGDAEPAAPSQEGAEETERLLREWGYAQDSKKR